MASLALALGAGWASAQTSANPAATTPNTGSSMTGGQAAPKAQPGTGTRNSETTRDDQLSRGDRRFIEDAAGDGMYEVQAGQLAASKAQSPDVKAFANKMVGDHEQANNELVQLANAKKVELPAAPPRGKRHETEKLGKKSGADFDKMFVAASIKDHEKDIKKFEKASGKVKDPQLKAWIDKTLPVLREHLAMAQKLKGGGKSAG
jgi:putative membrane protein